MANTFSGIKLQLETLPVHYKFLGCYHMYSSPATDAINRNPRVHVTKQVMRMH